MTISDSPKIKYISSRYVCKLSFYLLFILQSMCTNLRTDETTKTTSIMNHSLIYLIAERRVPTRQPVRLSNAVNHI